MSVLFSAGGFRRFVSDSSELQNAQLLLLYYLHINYPCGEHIPLSTPINCRQIRTTQAELMHNKHPHVQHSHEHLRSLHISTCSLMRLTPTFAVHPLSGCTLPERMDIISMTTGASLSTLCHSSLFHTLLSLPPSHLLPDCSPPNRFSRNG